MKLDYIEWILLGVGLFWLILLGASTMIIIKFPQYSLMLWNFTEAYKSHSFSAIMGILIGYLTTKAITRR